VSNAGLAKVKSGNWTPPGRNVYRASSNAEALKRYLAGNRHGYSSAL
jgi:hypothetical protein